jgi:hypothetical protein
MPLIWPNLYGNNNLNNVQMVNAWKFAASSATNEEAVTVNKTYVKEY